LNSLPRVAALPLSRAGGKESASEPAGEPTAAELQAAGEMFSRWTMERIHPVEGAYAWRGTT
jgi:hypothetical protein